MRAENAACKQADATPTTIEPVDLNPVRRTAVGAVTEGASHAVGNGSQPSKVGGFEPVSSPELAAIESAICGEDYDGVDLQAGLGLARLEADRDLIAHLARSGFAGPGQAIFEAELAAYAYPVMMAWTRTGEIIRKVAEKGRSLAIRDTVPGWSHEDRSELSTETVARALVFFRATVLVTGRWDAEQGATIRTYFVGACLFQFPNVYRRWAGERRRWSAQHVMTLDSPDDPDGLRQLRAADDVEFSVLTSGELAEVMADLAKKDPKLHRVAQLRLQGYTDAEAAREVGLSARALEGRWYRYRNEVRRRQNEAR